MNNLTDFSVFLTSKNQDGRIEKKGSIPTLCVVLDKNQFHSQI